MLRSIATNVADVGFFGLGVLTRHNGHFRSDRISVARLRGVGRVHLRTASSDLACFRHVFRDRHYSLPGVMKDRVEAQYRQLLSSGRTPVIIDAGANIGAATLWFARLYPDAWVLAVEPDPANFELLRRNVAHLPRVALFHAAIGAQPGYVQLTHPGLDWAIQTHRADSGVPVITVDQLLQQIEGSSLLLAKIDIEGFEKELFASNLQWLDSAYAVVVEPHDWMLPGEGSSVPMRQALARQDMDMYVMGENLAFCRAEPPSVSESRPATA